MDAQFWIYIIIGIIFFLSKLFKKPEQTPEETPAPERKIPRQPRPQGQQTAPASRPLTFEELLREITEGKHTPNPAPVPSYETLEQDPGEEARSLEEVNFDETAVNRWKPYEEVPLRTERKSLEETLKLEDTVVDFRKFEAFAERNDKRLLDDYLKIMRNPQTLKQAVVLSEILKRKF